METEEEEEQGEGEGHLWGSCWASGTGPHGLRVLV